MISIVLYGRNDNYGYNLHKRAALSLNCMAEVLTDPDDEILSSTIIRTTTSRPSLKPSRTPSPRRRSVCCASFAYGPRHRIAR